MPPIVFALLGTAVMVAIGIGLAFSARRSFRLAALIEATRTSKVRDLARGGGLVEVQGTVRRAPGAGELTAPISGHPCVYYHLVVQERRKRGKHSRLVTVISDRRRTGFVVDDGTGGVDVDVEQAELHLHEDEAGRSGFLQDAPPHVEEALNRYGRSAVGFVFNKNMRWRETFVEEGDALYALGTFDGRRVTRGRDGLLVVSDKGERGVVQAIRGRGRGAALGAGVCFVVAAVALAVGVAASL